MILEMFPSGPVATNAYLLGCREKGVGVFVDPGQGSSQNLVQAAEEHELQIQSIFLTHSHWDHFADAAALKKSFGIELYVHSLDAGNVKNPGSDGLPMYFPIEGTEVEHLLEGGETLRVGSLQIEVIHTPGHTPGGVCFYLPEENVLISGDTLFKGSIGNLSFPTADPPAMWNSLKELAKLPSETKVYPGHGVSTTIGEESWLGNAKEMFS